MGSIAVTAETFFPVMSVVGYIGKDVIFFFGFITARAFAPVLSFVEFDYCFTVESVAYVTAVTYVIVLSCVQVSRLKCVVFFERLIAAIAFAPVLSIISKVKKRVCNGFCLVTASAFGPMSRFVGII